MLNVHGSGSPQGRHILAVRGENIFLSLSGGTADQSQDWQSPTHEMAAQEVRVHRLTWNCVTASMQYP